MKRTGKNYGTVTSRAWLIHRGWSAGISLRETIRTNRESWDDLERSLPGSARDQRESSVAATQGARAEDEIPEPGRGQMATAAQAMFKSLD